MIKPEAFGRAVKPQLLPRVRRHVSASASVERVAWFTAFSLALFVMVRSIAARWFGSELETGRFEFERPWALSLATALPLVWWFQAQVQVKRQARVVLPTLRVLHERRPGFRLHLSRALSGMRAATLLLMVFALMGPQTMHVHARQDTEGIDLMLALDLSISMRATDIEPNRFRAMQEVVDDFLHRRQGDRVGTVVFGREAYTLSPLTLDSDTVRRMVAELQLGVLDGRGTAIGNAVGTALNRLRKSKAKSRVLVLLTDGESNSGNISPEQAAELADQLDVKIFAILMGQSRQKQPSGDILERLLRGQRDFPINPTLLRHMAKETGGRFFQAADRESLERSFHTILNRLEKSAFSDRTVTFGSLSGALLAPVALLMLLDFLLSNLLLRRWP